MLRVSLLCSLLFVTLSRLASAEATVSETTVLQAFPSDEAPKWVLRGKVEIPKFNAQGGTEGEVAVSQASVTKKQWRALVSSCQQAQSSEGDVAAFGRYRVEVKGLGTWSLHPCDVIRSQLTDEITITLVNGVSHYAHGRAVLPRDTQRALTEKDFEIPRDGLWATTVTFRNPVHSQTPDVDIPEAPAATATPGTKEVTPDEPEQSFLRKYWYVFAIVAVQFLANSFSAQQKAATGAAPAGRQQAATR